MCVFVWKFARSSFGEKKSSSLGNKVRDKICYLCIAQRVDVSRRSNYLRRNGKVKPKWKSESKEKFLANLNENGYRFMTFALLL